jgi:hypothetical protein
MSGKTAPPWEQSAAQTLAPIAAGSIDTAAILHIKTRRRFPEFLTIFMAENL